MIELLRATWAELVSLEGLGAGLYHDIAEIGWRGARARQASATALAVVLAVWLAETAHLDLAWWAGISGFMSVQATLPGSLQRAGLRVLGTAIGAGLAVLCAPALIDDAVLTSVFLFVIIALGVLGSLVASHGYAWLFFAITASLVLLMSIGDPSQTLHFALYRFGEVTLGSVAALVAVALLGPEGEAAAAAVPGWHSVLDTQWPSVMHAMRSGVAVALLPWVWRWFDVPGFSQMAVTVAAVMAVPVLADNPLEHGRRIAGRAFQRLLGCAVGGAAGLALLWFSVTVFAFWLAMLGAGIWVAAWVQGSARGVGYVGTQAAIVFIISVVQGLGPSDSLIAGLDRIAGMAAGLGVLFFISLLFWPEGKGKGFVPF